MGGTWDATNLVAGDTNATLRLLVEAVKAEKISPSKLKERKDKWSAAHERLEEKRRNAEAEAKKKSGITPVLLASTLAEGLPGNTIYLDETTVHGGINRRHVGNQGPQSYIAPRSGLGQGMGISAGVKLACKDRPVTLLVGDQEFDSPRTLSAFGLGLTLFLVTLALNIIAHRIVQTYREQYD